MITVNKNFFYDWMVLDGSPSGWVASTIKNDIIILSFFNNLNDIKFKQNTTIYIDIPLKLPDSISSYPRITDLRAKKLLGKYHSSIFYAPLKNWLDLSFVEINQICQRHGKPKLSIQSYNLFKKITEVQKFYLNHPSSFIEIHPELIVHYFIKNKSSKKLLVGQNQRLYCLNQFSKNKLKIADIYKAVNDLKRNFSSCKINVDDVIDSIFVSIVINYLIMSTNKHKNDIINIDELYKRVILFK